MASRAYIESKYGVALTRIETVGTDGQRSFKWLSRLNGRILATANSLVVLERRVARRLEQAKHGTSSSCDVASGNAMNWKGKAESLRAVNAELLAAARGLIDSYEASRGEVYGEDIRRLEAAIAKATEVTP